MAADSPRSYITWARKWAAWAWRTRQYPGFGGQFARANVNACGPLAWAMNQKKAPRSAGQFTTKTDKEAGGTCQCRNRRADYRRRL